jgi:hypothetical protein
LTTAAPWQVADGPLLGTFLPQIHDEVVYLNQGHSIFVEQAKKATFPLADIIEAPKPWECVTEIGIFF